MAQVSVLPVIIRTPGVYPFGPLSIPDTVNRYTVAVDITAFDTLDASREIFMIAYSISVNGLVAETRSFGRRGGPSINPRTLLQDTKSSVTVDLPSGVNRTIEGTLTILAILTTRVMLEVT